MEENNGFRQDVSKSSDKVVVLKQSDENVVFLKSGRGTMTKLINRDIGSRQIDLHLNKIKPYSDKGLLHYHKEKENAYFILEGKISIRTPEGDMEVKKGESAFIPPGVPHAVMNPSAEEAHVLEIYSPCIDDDFIEVR